MDDETTRIFESPMYQDLAARAEVGYLKAIKAAGLTEAEAKALQDAMVLRYLNRPLGDMLEPEDRDLFSGVTGRPFGALIWDAVYFLAKGHVRLGEAQSMHAANVVSNLLLGQVAPDPKQPEDKIPNPFR